MDRDTTTSNLLVDKRIKDAFLQHDHPSLRQVGVFQRAGTYIIQGQVESYFEKQIAQETLRCVVGLQKIDNQLVVTSY